MAPRPAASRAAASRGCHAVRSQIARTAATATTPASAASPPRGNPSPAPVWISDTLLARAFARFSRVSLAGRAASAAATNTTTTTATGSRRPSHVRLSSSVPGPLEARRRLGKRQMTEQLGLAQHSLPPLPYPFLTAGSAGESDAGGGAGSGWGSPMPSSASSAYSLDPRLWQWAPPRDPARHPAAEPPQRMQAQTSSLLPWLARIGDVLGEPTAAAQNEPKHAHRQPPQPATQELPRSAAARAFFDDLDAWRNSAAPCSPQSLEAISRALETQLRLAALTADEADEALGLIWAGLAQAAAASPSAPYFLRTHAPVLFTAVLRGVRACRLLPADAAAADLGALFWRRLLEGVCAVSVSEGSDKDRDALASLATDVLAATPPAFIARDLSDLVPTVLETAFCAPATDDARIAAVAAALQDVVVGEAEKDSGSSRDDVVTATTLRLLQRWTGQLQQQGPSPTPPQNREAKTAVASADDVPAGLDAWLRTLACMPQVRQENLFAVLAQAQECVQAAPGADCTAEGSKALLFSDAFLCDLLLSQWASRGYIPSDDVLLAYQQIIRENTASPVPATAHGRHVPSMELAALALAVYRTPACRPRCVALYVSLLTCLRRLGRGEAALAASVEVLMEAAVVRQDPAAATSVPPLPLPFLEALAWAADDLPTALRLHALYTGHARRRARANRSDPSLRFLRAMADSEPRRGRRGRDDGWPLWRLAFWNKFADRLGAELDRGALTPGQVSFALDLGERPRASGNNSSNNGKAKSLGEPTVALLERLAVHYALAPELVPRRALRGVEQCRAVLLQHAGTGDERTATPVVSAELGTPPPLLSSPASTPSPTILRAIFHLITRDLADAQPGRTSRLRWYVDMVQREHSTAAAKASARALERWRTAAMRVDRKQSRW